MDEKTVSFSSFFVFVFLVFFPVVSSPCLLYTLSFHPGEETEGCVYLWWIYASFYKDTPCFRLPKLYYTLIPRYSPTSWCIQASFLYARLSLFIRVSWGGSRFRDKGLESRIKLVHEIPFFFCGFLKGWIYYVRHCWLDLGQLDA